MSGLYALVVVLPSLFWDSELVPRADINVAVIACVLFVAGAGLGALVFRFRSRPFDQAWLERRDIRTGYRLATILLAGCAIYVAAVGPAPPMLLALQDIDSFEVALLREDAVKLNEDEFFVRIYSWARDLLGPVVFALSVLALRGDKSRQFGAIAVIGLVSAAFIALWSGQKATIINYLLATLIFSAADVRSMVRGAVGVVPVVLLLILFTFLVTQPSLFVGDAASWDVLLILANSILSRILWVPLEVAAVFVHSTDTLRIIRPLDALPYFSGLWTPGIVSIENRVAIEFYHQGIDSGHSNALAFAYAYVLAGYIGAFVGGIASMALLALSMKFVRATKSLFVEIVFCAYACYALLDLLNSNYLQYLVKILVVALLLWVLVLSLRRLKQRSSHAELASPGQLAK